MKKIINILFVYCICLSFMGCAKPPEDVINNAEKYNDKTKTTSDKDVININKVSLKYILQDKEEVLKGEYDNLILPNIISAKVPQKLGAVTLYTPKKYTENTSEIIKMFMGRDDLMKYTKYVPNSFTVYNLIMDTSIKSGDKKISVYASISDNGQMGLEYDPADASRSSFNIVNRKAVYRVDQGDDLDVEYQLYDEKCRVKDAVDYVNSWVNEKWSPFEEGYTFAVKTVYVCAIDDHNYRFNFDVVKYYEGVPFDDIHYMRISGKDKEDIYTPRNMLEVAMEKSNLILAMRSAPCYIKKSIDESATSFVSLKDAVHIVELTMSGFQKIKISDIAVLCDAVYEMDNGKFI